jgi:hypothetical protein
MVRDRTRRRPGNLWLAGQRAVYTMQLYLTTTQTEKAMTHKSMRLIISLAFLLVICSGSALRADDKDDKTNSDKPPMSAGERAILQQIKDLKADIKANGEKSDAKIQEIELRLQIMTDRVDRLEKSVNKIATTPRSSYFQPTPEATSAPVATGTIVLRNTFTDAATIFLNGRSYLLQPNQTVTLTRQPAGPQTYEVVINGWGSIRGGQVTTNLDTGRTLLIYVESVTLP